MFARNLTLTPQSAQHKLCGFKKGCRLLTTPNEYCERRRSGSAKALNMRFVIFPVSMGSIYISQRRNEETRFYILPFCKHFSDTPLHILYGIAGTRSVPRCGPANRTAFASDSIVRSETTQPTTVTGQAVVQSFHILNDD